MASDNLRYFLEKYNSETFKKEIARKVISHFQNQKIELELTTNRSRSQERRLADLRELSKLIN